ncbi:MAG: sigma-54-dependent transcriptional regulator [Thermoanaerobaculia bacterium]
MTETPPRRILLVDDDADILAGLGALLVHTGWEIESASSGREALRKFDAFGPDVVLLDVMLPDLSGLEVLEQIKAASELTAVVMMSGVGTIDQAVRAMKAGAETFVAKPVDFDTLEAILEQGSRIVETRRQLAVLRRSAASGAGTKVFAGVSAAARTIDHLIAQVAPSATPVLLTGESGTGKGVVTRLIHERSDRAGKTFVDLNCAGLSRELLESELFGHERGAFTDASATKQGLFEIAGTGTLFLDEIGEMEPAIQARLLKAIEEKRFRRVGGVRELKADFRLIAATNRKLDEEVAAGRFRRDLFYRLNVVSIALPPLRQRAEDVPILVEEILRSLAPELGSRRVRVSDRAMAKLAQYPWPGNVRELRNVLERALLLHRGEELRADDIVLEGGGGIDAGAGVPQNEWDIRPLEEVEREYVRQAVDATGGNVRSAARRLGVSPGTVYAKLGKEKK